MAFWGLSCDVKTAHIAFGTGQCDGSAGACGFVGVPDEIVTRLADFADLNVNNRALVAVCDVATRHASVGKGEDETLHASIAGVVRRAGFAVLDGAFGFESVVVALLGGKAVE